MFYPVNHFMLITMCKLAEHCRIFYITVLLLHFLSAGNPASAEEAADNSYYRLIVANCYTCHSAGTHEGAAIPRLDGLSVEQIKQLLNAYKTDQEQATIMNRISKALTDAEIERISAMFGREAH